MNDAPLEIAVVTVDGWLTVVTATGEWLYPGDEARSRLRDALGDPDRAWVLLDLIGVTFGCEEMVDTVGFAARNTRRRAGEYAIACTGKVKRVMEISSGGTVAVCESVEQARGLLEGRRREVEAGPGGALGRRGGQPDPRTVAMERRSCVQGRDIAASRLLPRHSGRRRLWHTAGGDG